MQTPLQDKIETMITDFHAALSEMEQKARDWSTKLDMVTLVDETLRNRENAIMLSGQITGTNQATREAQLGELLATERGEALELRMSERNARLDYELARDKWKTFLVSLNAISMKE